MFGPPPNEMYLMLDIQSRATRWILSDVVDTACCSEKHFGATPVVLAREAVVRLFIISMYIK